jgi:DNA-directed RNA polymerase alpha subunit
MKLEKRRFVIEIEKRTVDKRTGHISFQFRIGPFKKSMGTTVGSALRRTMLSMKKTLAITTACGNFNDGNCMREDLFELSLNLQRIHIKSTFLPYTGVARIRKKGPAIITAQDLKLEQGLEVVNPYQYICSVNESYTLNMCLMINSSGSNNFSDYVNPIKPIDFNYKNYIKNRESTITKLSKNRLNNLIENNTVDFISSESDSENSQNIKYFNDSSSKIIKNIKQESSTNNLKDSKIKLGAPQKLPFDIIIVDPIYSAIQSCGFEIVQTTNSAVAEYEDLVKRGVSETEEFIRFVVISRGAVEPATVIELATQELRETLSVFEPLSHVFACEKNVLLSLEKVSDISKSLNNREKVLKLHESEIFKKLDIKHLDLPISLEIFLRREGFTNINNLLVVPIEFLKRIGLKETNIKLIENSLNIFGFSFNINENMKWEAIPYFLPL